MRQVRWADDARQDYLQILSHIAADDPLAADRVSEAVIATGERLGEFATGHPGRVAGTYEKLVARLPHIITYALMDDDSTVMILRVIHSARDWRAGHWPE